MSINDSIRCKGNSQPDNYIASSHALLILITLPSVLRLSIFPSPWREGRVRLRSQFSHLPNVQPLAAGSFTPWAWRAGCPLPVSEKQLAKSVMEITAVSCPSGLLSNLWCSNQLYLCLFMIILYYYFFSELTSIGISGRGGAIFTWRICTQFLPDTEIP